MMTNNSLFEYNRQEDLKTWQPIPSMNFKPELIEYFNHKAKMDDVDIRSRMEELFYFETFEETDEYFIYLQYMVRMHMSCVIDYIQKIKGVFLGDFVWNIKQILNEIVNNEVDEDYYLNTIDIYEGISGCDEGGADIYDLLDQAIRLGSWRMIYYLIFREDEYMADRLDEMNKNKTIMVKT